MDPYMFMDVGSWKGEGKHLVIAGEELTVARTPKDRAIRDGCASITCTAAGKAPQNATCGCIQRIHVAQRVGRAGIHHTVGCRYSTRVLGLSACRVGRLPEDLACG